MTKEQFWIGLDRSWVAGDMEQFWKLWHGHPEFVNEKLDQIDRDLNDPTTELYKEHQEWWARIRPQLAAYMGEDWVKANCKE